MIIMVVLWLILGVVLALPLLAIAYKTKQQYLSHLFGMSLVIAALIYVVFAVVWGSDIWRIIELSGVAVYSLFYWLSLRYGLYWIAIGWLLHPIWDVALHLLGPGAHIAPTWYAIACLSFDLAVSAYIVTIYIVRDNPRHTQQDTI